jgi:hypothetical protein
MKYKGEFSLLSKRTGSKQGKKWNGYDNDRRGGKIREECLRLDSNNHPFKLNVSFPLESKLVVAKFCTLTRFFTPPHPLTDRYTQRYLLVLFARPTYGGET